MALHQGPNCCKSITKSWIQYEDMRYESTIAMNCGGPCVPEAWNKEQPHKFDVGVFRDPKPLRSGLNFLMQNDFIIHFQCKRDEGLILQYFHWLSRG